MPPPSASSCIGSLIRLSATVLWLDKIRQPATPNYSNHNTVADQVVSNGVVVGVVRRCRLSYLVRPAAPAQRDRGVRGVIDLVVRDGGVFGVTDVDGDSAVVLDRQAVQVVVQDLVAAGVVGGGGRQRHVHAAEVQPVAGDVGEHTTLDHTVLRPVPQVQPGTAEMDEGVVEEPHIAV